MKSISWLMAGLVCLGGLLVGGGTVWAFQQPIRERLPNLDKRQSQPAFSNAVPAEKVAAAENVRGIAPGARIDFDEVTGAPKWIGSTAGFLTGPGGKGLSPAALAAVPVQDPHRVTKAFIREHRNLFGHGPEALAAARIKRDYVTPHNGMKTVVWEQQLDGIVVFDSALISHTTRNGELVSVSSSFLPDLMAAAEAGTPGRAALQAAPAIPARRAVALAAASLAESVKEDDVAQKTAAMGAEQRQQLQAPGLKGDADAWLTWLPMNAGSLRLCWDVILTSRARGEMFRVLVDVQTGDVLLRRCLTDYISDASYRVFTSDSPSPLSPGYATPVTNQPPLVARTLVTLSALNTNASPLGWINDGGNQTLGNNVDAHTDRNDDDSPDLPRPAGSPFRVFDFTMDLSTQDPTNYSQAAVVQLFYLCNWYHDKLYELGFTEAAGNFQSNNFARGGLGNDAVQADAQDGGDTDNANFSTPPDGSPGRMQMYIFTGMSPRRDGDLDAEIVYHEHTHGLSWRLVGGGQGLGTTQSDGMGEGWSDFYSMSLLSEAGDDVNGNYASGAYASYKIGGGSDLQNYYFGIRRYPYSTDMSRNPLTFKDIDPAQADYCSSGAPYHAAMFGTCSATDASEVHNEGEVWCVALWEARANLINRYGWAAGNHLVLQLVTDGMKLTPAYPNFLQARDAIIQADLVDTGGANRNELWAAFAKRGMGFSATSPSSSTITGVRESFDLPDDLRITPSDGFMGRGPVGGPFTPNSVSFTLTNAGSNSLSWTLVNTSTWLDVSPTGGTLAPGGPAASVTASLNASATSLPMGIYAATVWFTNLNSHAALGRSFTLRVGQPDYYTELFDTTINDVAFQTFTFVPDGSASFYSVCREVAASFPTDPTGGTTVSLSDDSYAQVSLTGTNTVAIYNRRANIFFIGSNGYLTMNSGDSALSESFANHFNRPRVSACFDDLNPSSGGTVSWKQTSNLVAVTFSNVREYGTTATVSFQIEMFYDGRIRLTYLGVGIRDGLAGLSAGDGVPAGFAESDFTSYAACPPPDDLVVTPSAGLASQGYQGGPFTPSSATCTLSNVGTNSLTWSAIATQPWLNVSASNGSLAASAITNILIAINSQANLLAPGMYTATVTFSNLSSGFTQIRSVSLQVLAIPGEIAVLDSISPDTDLEMPFREVIVGLARTEHITVTNTDATYGLAINNISFGAYVENFDDGLAQDWVPDVEANWHVVAGEYRAQTSATDFMVSRYDGQQWTDLTMQMSCRRSGMVDISAGIALRATADFDDGVGSGYVFQVATDGSYSIWKQVNGDWSWLQSWTTSSAINAGTNVLTAVAQGSTLRFYINGTLVWSGTDTALPSGRIGLMGYSDSLDAATHYFDNVTVTDPITSFAAVSPQQQYYNAHPLTGGSVKLTRRNSPPVPVHEPRTEDGEWRSLSLASGSWRLENVPTLPHTLAPGGTLTFDVVYQPTAPNSNYAQVVIESNDADEPRVEVQLTGQGILDYLRVLPVTDFASQGHPGGPFSPSSTTYVLSNAAPVSISWASSNTQAWANVSPPSGTLAAGQSVSATVGVTATANSLPEGTYHDTIIFTNLTTTVRQQRNVALTVFTSPQVVVSPLSMAVTNVMGRSTNVTLSVSNALTADANLTFTISAAETGRSILSLAAAGVGLPPADRDFTKAAPDKEFTADRVLVRFAAGVQGLQRSQMLNTLGGAQIMREYKIVPGLCLVKLPAGQTIGQALLTYNRTAGILYAEPDYQVKAFATIPNDARFSELWGMHNTGQTGGTPDADIDAPEAWALNTGNRQVVVAVIDTGVDYTHPDLMNNIWTNPGEIPGNGIDDDGNGYVDDVHGYDFVNGNGNPMDDNEHGTHCSGTIGAEGNNGIGVAGVCWQARIMAVKFLDDSGSGTTADAISAVQYATLMGARVMNNSWGGGAYSQALKDAIDAAGAAGSVFVAAAGNDYGNNNDTDPSYPASYASANIVAVMSTDHNDLRSDFSNYGLTNVDLAAPGSSILSCQPGGLYQKLSGTSMATPHVSGACALLLSANPILSVAQIKQTLLSTVDPTLPGQCVSGGRLNLARALSSVGAGWITVTPSGATNVVPGAAVNVTVGFQADELAAGTYSGQLVIAGNDLVTPSVTVPVSMTILPENLQVTPTSVFASSGAQGGPFAPLEMVYTLTNSGASSLNWSVTHTQSWVSVSASSGTLSGGASFSVIGSINSAASLLAPTNYTDHLVFSNSASGAVRRRAVALSVVTPGLSIADASVLEGDVGSTNIIFTVSLLPPTLQTVTVAYATSNGTAQAGSDYVATNGLLTFTAGQTNQFITVTVLGDTNTEPNETFFVNLSVPVNALLARAQAIGTILTDDGLTLAQALDTPGWAWLTGGTTNSNWLGQTTNTHDGVGAAQSGLISHSQETWMETTVQGPGAVTFWWSVSSESGCDYLEFRTNGVLATRISGTVAWSWMSNRVASGTQTLRWRYVKDGSVNSGQDKGWVDQVSFWPDDNLRVQPNDALVSSGDEGGPFNPTNKVYALLNSGTSNLNWSASCAQTWVTVNPSGGSLAPSASNYVTVLINSNAQNFSNGTYTANVIFSNVFTAMVQTRPVRLTVKALPVPPPVPFGPIPTNYATGVSVRTLLSWNNLLNGRMGNPRDVRSAINSIVQRSGILSGPIRQFSSSNATGSKVEVVSYEKPEDVANVITAADRGIQTASALNVVVCAAESTSSFITDVTAKLLASGQFNSVSIIQVGVVTPTLAELQAFDAALVYSDSAYADAASLGNVMADYVDAGGGVVCALFELSTYTTSHYMQGRWLTGEYGAVPASSFVTGQQQLGTVYDPSHPIMVGVTSFSGGTSSFRPGTTTLTPGATLVAAWSDGKPLVAVKRMGNVPRADLGFYPTSSDMSSDFWSSATDGGLLMANALTWVAGGNSGSATHAVYFGTNSGSLSLIASNLTQTTCNPGTMAFNTTYYWQVVATNVLGSVTGAVWRFTTTLDEVRFASTTSSVAENGGSASITVVRENPAGGVLSVQYSTTNGTATAGSDYTAVSGTLTFVAGVMSTNFSVPILDDSLSEGNETVLLSLSQVTPNVFLGSNAVLTIIDNDGPPEFQIAGLFTTNSQVVDHDALTGDDRGGIAVSSSQVFVTGDNATARFNAADLTGGTNLGIIRDSLCADLRTETVYLLGNGSTPLTSSGGTVTTLIQLNGATGQPTGVLLPLSQSFSMPSSYNGIFSGYGRVAVYNGTRVYDIFLPSGMVTDRGAMTRPNWISSESWSVWGVAEYFGGDLYLTYARNTYPVTTIERARVADGATNVVGTFSNLSDMASFTVSPSRNRWYFHYEGSGQFGGTSETLGYADAILIIPNTPPAVIAQPVSRTVRPGTNVAFCVTASGSLPLSYQWRKDGTNLVSGGRFAGTTNACLTISSVAESDSGQYSVRVTNAYGATNSSDATLLVNALDHFAWGNIPSPQWVGTPFPATITARDEFDAVVSNFTGTVALNAFGGGGSATGTLLNGVTHTSYSSSSAYTLAIAFTPSTGLQVTHVRHYSGTKVSIWTDAGVLLASQNVVSTPGTWAETPLATPITLTAGTRYRVGAYYPYGTNYYYRANVPATFTNGTIDFACYYDGGDAFPSTDLGTDYLYLVDLRYSVGALVSIPIMPTNSGSFVNGAWTGNITVLQPATNMNLVATDSNGHRGMSGSCDVLLANDLSVAIVDRPDPVAVGGYLTNTITVVNFGPTAATGVTATNFLPASVSFVSASASQGSCVLVGSQVQCALGTLAGGAAATVTVVTAPGVAGQITNRVAVGRAEADPYAGNNSAASVTSVLMPALSIADASVVEGNAGTTNMVFGVQLSPPSSQIVSVAFATANGTALAGTDYIATNGLLTFVPGQTATNVIVTVLGDTVTEGPETLTVTLSSPVNAVLADGAAIGTIIDDEGQTVSLPYNLYDGYSYLWDIQQSGYISDGSNDAYDGGHVLSGFPSFASGLLVGGREVVIGPTSQGGLEISRRIYVPTNHAYARFLEVVRNPGGNSITTTVRIDSNLGSDSSTVLVGTSSGDTVFGTNDNWIVTDDTDGSGDPTVLHVIANDSGAIRPSAVSYSIGLLGYQYSVTVPAGETRIVMHFGAQNPNRATALAKAPDLTTLGQDALEQVAPADQVRIVNFGLPCSNCPPTVTAQPSSQTVPVGGSVTFCVTASGSAPLSYFWRRIGAPIAAATQSCYTLTNCQLTDSGTLFSCLISNAYGTVLSSNALLTVTTNAHLRIAIYGADYDYSLADVKTKLVATGLFLASDIDVYDAKSPAPTPTLSQLQQYAAVLTWTDYSYTECIGFGNALADYVDSGGGVVVAAFAFMTDSGGIDGRIVTGGYLPFTRNSSATAANMTLVKDDPSHFLLQGVSTFNGGSSSYHNDISLASGATLVAHWSNGRPLIGTKEIGDIRVVGLNMWPTSSDVDSDGWLSSTDGGRIMANALLWAAGGSMLPRPVHHFTWGSIAPTQQVNVLFPVSLTAQDSLGNTITNFAGPVALSGLVGGGVATNTILGSVVHSSSDDVGSSTYTIGYAFTPSTNITVTHVRHYFGSKVSIWTEGGALLLAQNVNSTLGTWTETPLVTPLQLLAGTRYRVGVYFTGSYYSRNDMAGVFPDGTIDQSYEVSGDAFPNSSDLTRWWFVDLRYTVGSYTNIPIVPTIASNFVGGIWSGSVAVLAPGTGIRLAANDGSNHSGFSTPFNVIPTVPPGTVITVANPALHLIHGASAQPYPSTILVTNLGGWVSKVSVTLSNLAHTWPDDLDILLVGPGGQKVMLMSDAVGDSTYGFTNLTLTFDDNASLALPQSGAITSGAYRPTDFDQRDLLPAPAPLGPYGTNLSVFVHTNVNGLWSLYIADDYPPAEDGVLANGWSLRFEILLPRLAASLEGTNTVVSWPTSFPGQLEWASDLKPPVMWILLSPQPPIVQVNGRNTVTLPTAAAKRFYRLRPD